MGNRKEKRIKRLKKKRIWPFILGLVIMLFVFCVVIALGAAAVLSEVANRKLTEGYEKSVNMARLYRKSNDGFSLINEERMNLYLEVADEIEAISVIDNKGNAVWSSNGVYPKVEHAIDADFSFLGNQSVVNLIFDENEYAVTIDDDGMVSLNESVVFQKLHFNFTDIFLNSTKSLLEFNVWFLIPTENGTVCVLNAVNVYGYDIQMIFLVFIAIGILIGVFALYYIISFVSVIISQRKMTKIIYTDMITGGENWLYFTKKSSKLIKRKFSKRKYAVVHLRMQKYRSFCTCFGINKGEELIERIYYTVKKKIHRNEVLAHYEKADFGLLLTYSEEMELAIRLEEMIRILDEAFPNIKLKFRFGVCEVENASADVEELYNNAVLARELLGDDKEQKIAFFNIEMNKQRIWERKVEDDMERALTNREFQVYLQPKFSTGEETLGGAEALVRWIHPTEGFVSPNRFIPIFEKNGFILKLDDYMLEEVARQQAKWISEGWTVVPISVNVSRAHFTRDDLAEHICKIVDKYQVPHDVIELELTESAFFDDKDTLLSTVKKLRDAGFSVSMDDFGAGYSSLNSLRELSIDVLKIDADFFRGTDSLERGMLIVSEVINLAKKLNMKIVAEGIENREQVDFLTEQECDLIQGYYYAKPMPLEEFEKNYKR